MAPHLQKLSHREAIGGVQILEVELDTRLDEELRRWTAPCGMRLGAGGCVRSQWLVAVCRVVNLLSRRLEKGDTVVLGANVVENLHVLVVSVAQPHQNTAVQRSACLVKALLVSTGAARSVRGCQLLSCRAAEAAAADSLGDELKVWHLEILDRYQPWVPQRAHDFLKVAQLAEGHGADPSSTAVGVRGSSTKLR